MRTIAVYRLTLFASIVILCILALATCNSSSNSEEISRELADRLTDSLDFEGGKITESTPPDYDESNEHPQIEYLDVENKLTTDEDFTVDIMPDSDSSPVIPSVMIWVKNSGKRIDVPLNANWHKASTNLDFLISLDGFLEYDSELVGKTFEVYVALFGEDGITGKHELWELTVVDPDADGDEDRADDDPDGDGDSGEVAIDGDKDNSAADGDLDEDNPVDGDNTEDGDLDDEIEAEAEISDGDVTEGEIGETSDREISEDSESSETFSVADGFGCTVDDTPVDCLPTEMDTMRPTFAKINDAASVKRCREDCELSGNTREECISSCQLAIIGEVDIDDWSKCYGCVLYAYDEENQVYDPTVHDVTKQDAYDFAYQFYEQFSSGEIEIDITEVKGLFR